MSSIQSEIVEIHGITVSSSDDYMPDDLITHSNNSYETGDILLNENTDSESKSSNVDDESVTNNEDVDRQGIIRKQKIYFINIETI